MATGMGDSIEETCQPSGRIEPIFSSRLLPETLNSTLVESHIGIPSAILR